MKFKTKMMHVAVLGAIGFASTAQAAILSEDGTGEVLLYPYYTVQNGTDTLISVVNTTTQGKAVKVRVLEGMNSREVIDFNLYLSPNDVWTAVITNDAATGGAKLVTNDKSCTAPAITGGSVSFRNYNYSGAAADGASTSLTRTREGYVEMIEMGTVNNAFALTGTTFGTAITHVNGVAPGCAAVQAAWAAGAQFDSSTAELTMNSGGLIGSATLINVAQGVDYSYDPIAIDDFNDSVTGNHTGPGATVPTLANASPVTSTVFHQGAAVTVANWGATTGYVNSADAVSALLQRQSVMNEYTVNTGLSAGTDQVLTFPTKRFYVASSASAAPVLSRRPFTTNFLPTGACEPVTMTITDREEARPTSSIDFSPPAPGTTTPSLCWEVNVVTMNNTNVLGSSNLKLNVDTAYTDGWMTFQFLAAGHNMADDVLAGNWMGAATDNYRGLPVVGFGVQKYVNGNVGGVLSNYGGSFSHKYRRIIN